MTGNDILKRTNYMVNGEIENQDALDGINLALDDLSIEAPRMEILSLTVPANTRTITLPTDLLSLEELWYTNVEMTEVENILKLDPTVTGIPSRYQVIGRTLYVHPIPTVETILTAPSKLGYDHIVDLTVSPTTVPERFHLGICYFLAYMFWSNDEEDLMMDAMEQKYEKYKYALAQYQNNVSGYPSMSGGD